MKQVSRIDLHVHTRFSNDADDFLLGALGVQECYSTPQQIYELASRRGMDFVTITDHDTLNGALEIAHLENVVIGEEITTFFPEDGVKIHVVALDIDESNHEMIAATRRNVYELIQYLNTEEIVHFVAHPFFRMGPPLTLAHFEKMLLLFKRFEVKNGGKQTCPDDLIENLLQNLTEETLLHLANKYDLGPEDNEPWIKYCVAGSDDHGGILVGMPHTLTPYAESADALMRHIRNGHTKAWGEGGTPLAVAHSIFSVGYHHFHTQSNRNHFKSSLKWHVLGRFFDNLNPSRSLSVSARMLLLLHEQRNLFGRPDIMVSEFAKLIRANREWRTMLLDGLDFNTENNEHLFELLCTWVHGSMARVLQDARRKDGKLTLRFLKALRPVLPVILVYMIAFKTETRDRALMRRVREKYAENPDENSRAIAVFTDNTSREVVASLVMKYCRHIHLDTHMNLAVFGLSDDDIAMPNRVNYRAVGTIQLKGMEIAIPPALNIARHIVEKDIEHLYLHSFGPMGLLGLILGKWLDIPVSCHYPRIKQLEEISIQSPADAHIKDRMVRLLLSLVDHVTVGSHEDFEALLAQNISPEKIEILHPDHERRLSDSESESHSLEFIS